MPLVYWISDGVGGGVVKGGPDGRTPVATAMVRWIRTKGSPALIVNGGDVYPDGKSRDFGDFFAQMDQDVRLLCETPGNHDYRDAVTDAGAGRIPHGYEAFWGAHPESKQPVDATKRGGARYEHFIDVGEWRLLFLDTGDTKKAPWPAGDPARVAWLTTSLKPGRRNLVFMHHSRLSRGQHGDIEDVDEAWRALFDASGAPRVAATFAGHDHNVSIYGPRSRDDPRGPSVPFADGIHVIVNGAGGTGHYSHSSFLARGTKPDVFKDGDHFCVSRINVIDAGAVDVDVLDFGTHAERDPVPVAASLLKIRV